MNREEALFHAREVLRSTFGVKPEDIRETTRAKDVQGWDSLSHLVVLIGIEKRLKVKLPLSEAYDAENVGALIDLATRIAQEQGGLS
jgi:acyl carrier protein